MTKLGLFLIPLNLAWLLQVLPQQGVMWICPCDKLALFCAIDSSSAGHKLEIQDSIVIGASAELASFFQLALVAAGAAGCSIAGHTSIFDIQRLFYPFL
jgi:hypothetical protein